MNRQPAHHIYANAGARKRHSVFECTLPVACKGFCNEGGTGESIFITADILLSRMLAIPVCGLCTTCPDRFLWMRRCFWSLFNSRPAERTHERLLACTHGETYEPLLFASPLREEVLKSTASNSCWIRVDGGYFLPDSVIARLGDGNMSPLILFWST